MAAPRRVAKKWMPKASQAQDEHFDDLPDTGSTESGWNAFGAWPNKGGALQGHQDGGTGGPLVPQAFANFSTLARDSQCQANALWPMEDSQQIWQVFTQGVILPSHTAKGLHVRLSNRKLGDEVLIWLAQYLDGALQNLEAEGFSTEGIWCTLELDHNNLRDKGLVAFIEVLERRRVSIRRACLYKNWISDIAATRLAAAVGRQRLPLQELHLSHNQLTGRSVVAICIAVAAQRSLNYEHVLRPDVPCWTRLEHNRIAEPTMVLELLREHGVPTCMARSRTLCGPGRCAYLTSGQPPQLHLFLLASQRTQDVELVNESEIRDTIHHWQSEFGAQFREAPHVNAMIDAECAQQIAVENDFCGAPEDSLASSVLCVEARQPVINGDVGVSEERFILSEPPPGVFEEDMSIRSRRDEDLARRDAVYDAVPAAANYGEEAGRSLLSILKVQPRIAADSISATMSSVGKSKQEHISQAVDHVAPVHGEAAGRELLSMLRTQEAVSAQPRPEPQPLSTDEYQLWVMQAREDAEGGADELNAETFGIDHGRGWSFEENLAANDLLTQRLEAESLFVKQTADRHNKTLGAALREMSNFLDLKPKRLKEAIRSIILEGWSNITWHSGFTAFHLAAELNRPEVMPLLLAVGGDPNTTDVQGQTPLDVAKHNRHDRCVDMLERLSLSPFFSSFLRKQSPASSSTMQGRSGRSCSEDVQQAERAGQVPVPAFVAPGLAAQIRQADAQECSTEVQRLSMALREAARFLHIQPLCLSKAVMHLLASGSSFIPGCQSTVLHLVAELGRHDLIPLLVALGCNPFFQDWAGRTAMDIACIKKHHRCMEVLQKFTMGRLFESVAPTDTRLLGVPSQAPTYSAAPDYQEPFSLPRSAHHGPNLITKASARNSDNTMFFSHEPSTSLRGAPFEWQSCSVAR